jgi:hypothetical protein
MKVSTLIILGFAMFFVVGCANSSGMNLVSNSNATTAGDSIISSSGTMMPNSPADDSPGSVEGVIRPHGNPTLPINDTQAPENWLTYVDGQFGFSISYPDTYVILPESAQLPQGGAPGLVHRVRFLDGHLAKSETANLQPPDFKIELFENPAGTPLRAWVDANAPGGSIKEVKLKDVSCLEVTMTTLMAPNEFIFCAWNTHIYRLTPLGAYSEQMLGSFKFGQ